MCKPNNQSIKILTKKDFFNAFMNSQIKDTQTGETLRHLVYNEGMDIAAEVAYSLYCEAMGITEKDFICLSDRQSEFTEALKRGFDQDLDVYEGWDKDTYFVVNKTNKSEYKVEFKTINGKVLVRCECPDFIHRNRICKHVAQKLMQTMFGSQPMPIKAR